MRMIDADELYRAVTSLWETSDEEDFEKGVFAAIENAPIIEERKKGKWVTYVISMVDGEGCRCSECGFEGVPYWDFCPNCGADMRGGQDE